MVQSVNLVKVNFKFNPQEIVTIKPLECKGRIERCVYDGLLNYYNLYYFSNGDMKYITLTEDELE